MRSLLVVFIAVVVTAKHIKLYPPPSDRAFFKEDYDVEEERFAVVQQIIPVELYLSKRGHSGTTDLLYLNLMDIYGKTTGESPLYGHGELNRGANYTFEFKPLALVGPPATASLRIVGKDGIFVRKLVVEVVKGLYLDCLFQAGEVIDRLIDNNGTHYCHFENGDLKSWNVRLKTDSMQGWHGTNDDVMVDIMDTQSRHSGWMLVKEPSSRWSAGSIETTLAKMARLFTDKIERVFVWKTDTESGLPESGDDDWVLQYLQISNAAGSHYFPFNSTLNSTSYCFSVRPFTSREPTRPVACRIEGGLVPIIAGKESRMGKAWTRTWLSVWSLPNSRKSTIYPFHGQR